MLFKSQNKRFMVYFEDIWSVAWWNFTINNISAIDDNYDLWVLQCCAEFLITLTLVNQFCFSSTEVLQSLQNKCVMIC
jgi:hypothetical protein